MKFGNQTLHPPSKGDFEDRIMRVTFAKKSRFMTLSGNHLVADITI